MFRTLIDIIAAPGAAFAGIRQKPTVLLPMLLVLGSLVSIQLGFFLNVDPEYMVDQFVEQALIADPAARESTVRDAYSSASPQVMAGAAAVSTAVVLLIITAINAVYLNLVSKLAYEEIDFKAWFALVWWTSVPTVFVAVAAWVAILSADNGLITIEDTNPLSLNALFFHVTGPWQGLLMNTNLIQMWCLALMVMGYRQWTQKSWGKSAAIALAPTALIYGIWALFIAL